MYKSFLRNASIAITILIPSMLWEEIGSRLGIFPFGIRGSLTLPAFYGMWSAAFILAQLKHGTAPGGAPAIPGGTFISRYGITPGESELLVLLLQGKSYKDIMSRLSISMPTVKSHVRSSYRKTGTAEPTPSGPPISKYRP